MIRDICPFSCLLFQNMRGGQLGGGRVLKQSKYRYKMAYVPPTSPFLIMPPCNFGDLCDMHLHLTIIYTVNGSVHTSYTILLPSHLLNVVNTECERKPFKNCYSNKCGPFIQVKMGNE